MYLIVSLLIAFEHCNEQWNYQVIRYPTKQKNKVPKCFNPMLRLHVQRWQPRRDVFALDSNRFVVMSGTAGIITWSMLKMSLGVKEPYWESEFFFDVLLSANTSWFIRFSAISLSLSLSVNDVAMQVDRLHVATGFEYTTRVPSGSRGQGERRWERGG